MWLEAIAISVAEGARAALRRPIPCPALRDFLAIASRYRSDCGPIYQPKSMTRMGASFEVCRF